MTNFVNVDPYLYVIVALLPLTASMVVFQSNPYHALILRGILGAISALVYAVLGAADVALTEALMGTMLAITLYAVAVRSSLVLRLGVLKDEVISSDETDLFKQLTANLRAVFSKHYMRLELVPYPDLEALHQALIEKEVHATCARRQVLPINPADLPDGQPYYTATRLRRLYEIMQTELSFPSTTLNLINAAEEKQ